MATKWLLGAVISLSLTNLLFAQPFNREVIIKESTLRFEENKGQIADRNGNPQSEILFTMKADGLDLFFTSKGISYQWHYAEKLLDGPLRVSEATGQPIQKDSSTPDRFADTDSAILHTYRMDMQWKGSSDKVEVIAEESSDDYNNYYLSHCPQGVLGVKSFKRLIYRNLYPNIDVVYYVKEGHLKYDVMIHKGGKIQDLAFSYNGTKPKLNDGKVRLETPLGFLEEQQPVSYFISGELASVHYRVNKGEISFRAEEDFEGKEVTIDPELLWATYYGGTSDEYGASTTVDLNDNVYLYGNTGSTVSISSAGHQNGFAGVIDTYLVKFNNLGVRQWATYYGGTANETASGITTDTGGNILIVGRTESNSGIASGGYQNTFGGGSDAFLAKFGTTGSLTWATYYGGTEQEYGYAVTTDASDNIFISGLTNSTTGIALNGYQNTNGGGQDAFLTKFNSAGALQWGTYFGGTSEDGGVSVGIDLSGNIFLGGYTLSSTGIVSGGHQLTIGGGRDAFIAKFNATSGLMWSSYYGGIGTDSGTSIAVDSNGDVYLAGLTGSINDISFNGHQNTFGGGTNSDGFLVKFNTSGARLWGTYYGGSSDDAIFSVTAVGSQSVFVTGESYSSNGIAAGAYQNSMAGYADAIVAKFSSSGSLQWGTFYGGPAYDTSQSICLDPSGNVYIAGATQGTGIAYNGFQNGHASGSAYDAFLVKLSDVVVMPTTQATNIQFTSRTGSSIVLNVTNGDAVSRIIVAKAGSPVDAVPINAITYVANSVFGTGTQLGSGNFVVGSGSAPFTITGLTSSTNYYFRIFEFNGTGGTEIYNSTTAVGNPSSATTLALKPLSQASFSSISSPTTTSLTLNLATGNGSSRIIIGKSGSAVNSNPVDGTTFTSNNSFGLGSQLGSGNFVVGIGTGPITVTGLTSGTNYYFSIYEYNGAGGTENYDLDAIVNNSISATTISNAPTTITPTLIQDHSFQANWLFSIGATDYRLDISSDNFSTYVPGFNNSTVSGTSKLITGLSLGTTYQYRVRANNSSGASSNSNVSQALTFPSTVTANAASSISQTGFTANWSTVAGVTNYQLDVSSDNFSTFAIGYNNLPVTGTTQVISGLQSGTQYQYRLRATNTSGSGANSGVISVITIPTNPVASSFSGLTSTGFTANWNLVPGVTNYLLDVSTNNFVTFVTGYNSLVVNGISQAITGLNAATTYVFRVRASNSSGASNISNVISVLTTPASPVIAVTSTNATQDGFTITWPTVAGADSYLLEVSTSATFAANDPLYNNLSVTGTQKIITNLSSGLLYYARLSSKNSGGVSTPSNTVSQLLIPPNPVLNDPTLIGTTSFKVSWGSSIGTDKYLIELSKDDFVSLIAGYAPKQILTGLEEFVSGVTANTVYKFRIKAQNAAGISGYSNVRSVQTLPSGTGDNSISHDIQCPTGGEVKDYRIISVPKLQSMEINTSLTDATYEKNWRIMHWSDHTGDVKSVNELVPGSGYWINSNFSQRPVLTVKGTEVSQPFAMTLKPGWNQIGNPFTFDISWADVLAQNPSVTNMGSLYTYNDPVISSASPFATYDGLLAYKGGFVNNMTNAEVTLIIPTSVKHFGGRLAANQPAINTSELVSQEWFVPLTLTIGEMTNQLGGFGMHPDANMSLDRWDAMNLPHFFSYVDMNTTHLEFFQPSFMRDVVPTTDKFDWTFSVSTSSTERQATLRWDNMSLGTNSARLFLYDPNTRALVDMKKATWYTFLLESRYDLKFFYSKSGDISPDISDVLPPYPNPFSDVVTIPFITSAMSDNIQVQVMDMMGKPLRSLQSGMVEPGYHELVWDGTDEHGARVSSGVYIYRVSGSVWSGGGKLILK